jgi:hypothetical protein
MNSSSGSNCVALRDPRIASGARTSGKDAATEEELLQFSMTTISLKPELGAESWIAICLSPGTKEPIVRFDLNVYPAWVAVAGRAMEGGQEVILFSISSPIRQCTR